MGKHCESQLTYNLGVCCEDFSFKEQIFNTADLSEMLGLSSENCGWNSDIFTNISEM